MSGIVIFGLNGSGKSTLAKALATELDYKYMDLEDYVFIKTEVPYSKQRTRDEYLSLVKNDIDKYKNYVLASVKCNFGDDISSSYSLGIFLDVPYDVRIERVINRMNVKFGNRVKEGGDMYETEMKFLEFVKARSIDTVTNWSETLECPVIKLDGTKTIDSNVKLISNAYKKMNNR